MNKNIATNKKLIIAMCAIILCLLVIIAILTISQDKNGPGIKIEQSKMQYVYGCDNDKLLFGITAYDMEDGDVTDTVVVEKRHKLSVGKIEVVKYAACDKNGNVTYMEVMLISEDNGSYKILPYEYYEVDYDTLTVTIKDANITGKVENAIIDVNDVYEKETNTSTESENSTSEIETTTKKQEEISQEDVTTEKSEEQATKKPQEQATKKPQEQATKKPQEQATKKPEETTTKEQQETTKPATNIKPVMTLKQSEITIQAGTKINWVLYVKNITDDKDSRDSLFRKIHLTKNIDVNVKGDVTQGLYCVDSDGNRSEIVYLLIHIQ